MLQAYTRKPAEPIFQQPRKKTAFEKTPACFQTAVRKLNLAPEDGDSLYAVTLHTMRHTFASWLAQSGKVTLMELQKLMRQEHHHDHAVCPSVPRTGKRKALDYRGYAGLRNPSLD